MDQGLPLAPNRKMAVNFLFGTVAILLFFSSGRLYLEMFIGKNMDIEGSKRRS